MRPNGSGPARLQRLGPGRENPEPSHNLNSPVGKLLGYKVSVGRFSRTALSWRNMYSVKQNPRPAVVSGGGLLRAECEEKEPMTCHSPCSQLVCNFIADCRRHTVSKPDGPIRKARGLTALSTGSGQDDDRPGYQLWTKSRHCDHGRMKEDG